MKKVNNNIRYKIKKIILVLTCVMLSAYVILICGCQLKRTGQTKITKDIYAMDTYMSLSVYEKEEIPKQVTEQAVEKAADEIRRIESLVSAHTEGSELAQLNSEGKALFSKDGTLILEKCIEIYEMTDGAFNPAIYPVMELWGFATKEYRVPEQSELDDKLTNMDVNNIVIQKDEENAKVMLSPGMKLDFGGIAKGYTSDRVISLLKENKVESAIINLGGNVHALGSKPDGTPWNTAIRHPEKEGYLGVVEVVDKAVITSGGYERYFENDGKTYHHIIDPQTGRPAENGIVSVSIISADGMLADGLSTALYVMGYEKAVSVWRENNGKFDFVMMTDDGKIHVTEGIKNQFTSDYSYSVIAATVK